MTNRNGVLLCVLAAFLLAAPTARAEVTVLGLRSLEGDEALAERMTDYLREFIVQRGVDTVSDKTQTLEQMLLLGDCGDEVDSRCLREIAELLEASEVVYGFISRMPGEGGRFTYAIDVRRFSASSRRDVELANINLESTRQGTANVQIATNTLIDTLWGREPETTLIVQSNEPDAAVYVDDELVGRTGSEPLWVAGVEPGEHDVRVIKDGFDPWERVVDISNNQYRLLEAPLTGEGTLLAAGPGEVGPEPGGEVGPEPGGEEPTDDDWGYWEDWHNWAGWGSIAGGVIFAGVGIGMSVGVDGINEDAQLVAYRQATPTGQDACDRAASDPDADYIVDLCDSGKVYQIMQFVMYGLAAAAAGTGVYFLVTAGEDGEEEPADETALAVTPWGLPGGGGLGLTGWF